MTNLSGASNPPNLTLPVHTPRKDRERKENKCILATCAIGKRINHADSFVGTLWLEASLRSSSRIVIKKYI